MENQALWTEELTEQETEDLLTKLEKLVRERKFEVPAILFLEMHKPVSRLAGNALIVFAPFVAPFVGIDNVHNYSRMLMQPGTVEKLILRLEQDPEPDQTKEEKAE